jgi:hypothetical protein
MVAAPAEFELPRHVEGGWQIGEYHFEENPRFIVPSWCVRLVRMWLAMRQMGGSSLSSSPLLPRSGGYGDQQALAMDAFALLDGWMDQRQAQAERG